MRSKVDRERRLVEVHPLLQCRGSSTPLRHRKFAFPAAFERVVCLHSTLAQRAECSLACVHTRTHPLVGQPSGWIARNARPPSIESL